MCLPGKSSKISERWYVRLDHLKRTVLLSVLFVHGNDPTLHRVVDTRIRHNQLILLLDPHGII